MLSHWKVAKINPGRRGNRNYSMELWMRCMTNRRGKTLLLYFVVLLGFGFVVSGTAAHSRLVKSDPSARAVLDVAPKELKLWFNEAVEPAFARVWIVPAAGTANPFVQPRRQF
jgi:hypothetical protein